ncbi:MFS transporter [Rhodopila sp.]|jgi:DHA2 family multidrug resistance protein-like MFS transporter|uniref:MFS transporter n=1 Tax=Rhodopila sp. TaxID=2480087 RepID=UPI002C87344B|nr:MFS transporter [Rhodopila sp.]HVZ08033.1 MFS transporter [Rhodopila sp.]
MSARQEAAPRTITVPTRDGLRGARLLWAVGTLVIAVGMSSLDTSIANTALPTIAADLNASPASSVWVVNAYQLALVVSLLPVASLGEILGYRRIYVWGVAVFTLSSLACAMSWSLSTLTVARIVQGFGASGIMSVNTALIRFIYPSNRLGRGVGFNAMVVAVSTAIGPSVAAGILSVASWQWLFAVNGPLGLIAFIMALRALPDTPRHANKFDAASAALNAATFGLLIFGIGEAAHGAERLVTAAVLGGACAFGSLLIRRQLGLSAPMLPVDLYRRPMFALSSLTAFCSFAAQGLAFVSLPFYFQTGLGLTAVQTGLLLTPWPVMTGIMAPIAGPLSDRFPPAILGGIGLATLCVGLALIAVLGGHPGTFGIVWRMMVCGCGFGFFQSPNLRAIMSSAPPERSGGASGIVATSRLVGQATGAALVAFCFGLSMAYGPSLALGLGAFFAGAGSIVSFSRLAARPLGVVRRAG